MLKLLHQKIFLGNNTKLVTFTNGDIGVYHNNEKWYNSKFEPCNIPEKYNNYNMLHHIVGGIDFNFFIIDNKHSVWKIKKDYIDNPDFSTYKNILLFCTIILGKDGYLERVQIYKNEHIIFEERRNIDNNYRWLCGRFIIKILQDKITIYDPFNDMKKVFVKASFKKLSQIIANENNLLTLETIKSGASYSCNVKSFDISMLRDDKKYEKYVEGIILSFLGKDVNGLIKNYLIY